MRRSLLIIALSLAACSGGGAADAPRATDASAPTDAPEITLPALEGLGEITFGKSFDAETLLIDRAIVKFRRKTASIAWSAQFS